MDLRRKLGMMTRLTSPAAASLGPAAAHPDACDNAKAPSAAGPVAPASERGEVIEELRRKIASVLGRPPPEQRLADPSATLLPFQKLEREDGVLYQRLERLPPSYHVGRMPIDAAASAQSDLLALLALDPSLSAVCFRRALFVDTETTGLGGGAGILPFLVGLARFDQDGTCIEQLLLRRPMDEPALLGRVHECFAAAEVIVTYNGKAFDLPLLAGRMVMNRLGPLPVRPHLDLLHVARRLHRARLGQCRLVSLESAVLGFGRGPDVAGADIAARYTHFLRTGDESALEAVVTHNAWDVVSMAALVGLYGEPLELLPSQDLVGMARTLRRAGALDRAVSVVDRAVEKGGGGIARRARGEIHKARGDRARALVDFEAALQDVDEPSLRLELAKLYEHFVKAPGLALKLVESGTGEDEERLARRRTRLLRKSERTATLQTKKRS